MKEIPPNDDLAALLSDMVNQYQHADAASAAAAPAAAETTPAVSSAAKREEQEAAPAQKPTAPQSPATTDSVHAENALADEPPAVASSAVHAVADKVTAQSMDFEPVVTSQPATDDGAVQPTASVAPEDTIDYVPLEIVDTPSAASVTTDESSQPAAIQGDSAAAPEAIESADVIDYVPSAAEDDPEDTEWQAQPVEHAQPEAAEAETPPVVAEAEPAEVVVHTEETSVAEETSVVEETPQHVSPEVEHAEPEAEETETPVVAEAEPTEVIAHTEKISSAAEETPQNAASKVEHAEPEAETPVEAEAEPAEVVVHTEETSVSEETPQHVSPEVEHAEPEAEETEIPVVAEAEPAEVVSRIGMALQSQPELSQGADCVVILPSVGEEYKHILQEETNMTASNSVADDMQHVSSMASSGLPETGQSKDLAAPVQMHPLLEKMAVEALRLEASDIFINTEYPPAFKLNGVVTPIPIKLLTPDEVAKVVYSTMNGAQKSRFCAELELNYAVRAKNGVRFRVNTYHEQGRIGMVMRRITTDIPTIDELYLPQALKDLAMRQRGLVVIAGATGSGKSTTQAAMLDWRNEHAACHIVTIEDPIEFVHKPKKSIITHREVGIDTLSWSNAVQSAMREAPDVVCIGEVRNRAGMEYAMQLAQTGHLCFFTIHANNANQALDRILNFYPKEFHQQVLMDLALNLSCVIGQRLVIKKDGQGRRAIVDLLINTSAMQDYIFKAKLMDIKALMGKSGSDGMQTFDQDLFTLYRDGLIDYNEALRQADSANDLRLQIKLYEDGRQGDNIYEKTENLNLV